VSSVIGTKSDCPEATLTGSAMRNTTWVTASSRMVASAAGALLSGAAAAGSFAIAESCMLSSDNATIAPLARISSDRRPANSFFKATAALSNSGSTRPRTSTGTSGRGT